MDVFVNFQHLRYFLMVAEELNITRAAERLYISQQSLSAHISNIERELEVKLFTRSPKLSLTYAGDLLVATATQILELHSQYLSKVGDINKQYLGCCGWGGPPPAGWPSCLRCCPGSAQSSPWWSSLCSRATPTSWRTSCPMAAPT